jgi:hypothetical protein
VDSLPLEIDVRFCDAELGNKSVFHVTQVLPNSPAAVAGFLPDLDYILAASTQCFHHPDDFFKFIKESDGKSVSLIVYRLNTGLMRVSIQPNDQWVIYFIRTFN